MTEGSGWTDTELARLRLEGIDHLNRLLSGEATDRDAAEFVAWRMRSRAHEEAFRSAVRLREMVRAVETGQALDMATADTDDVVVSLAAARERRVSRRMFIGGGMAASVAGGLFVAGRSLDLVPSPAELAADYRTGTGERRLVQLSRGASVELNTRTSINLRHDLPMPAVELVSGEAVLTTGAHADVALIAAKGTSVGRDGRFTVRRDGDAICVTCLAGEVGVEWGVEKRQLRAAEQVRYNGDGIEPVTNGVDVAALTAWQSGTLIFRKMPMRAVIAEINRYRPGKVILMSGSLANRPLTGTYYVNRIDDFFSQAQLALGAKVTRLPGDVVVLS
jgi:transmembrane sensor